MINNKHVGTRKKTNTLGTTARARPRNAWIFSLSRVQDAFKRHNPFQASWLGFWCRMAHSVHIIGYRVVQDFRRIRRIIDPVRIVPGNVARTVRLAGRVLVSQRRQKRRLCVVVVCAQRRVQRRPIRAIGASDAYPAASLGFFRDPDERVSDNARVDSLTIWTTKM